MTVTSQNFNFVNTPTAAQLQQINDALSYEQSTSSVATALLNQIAGTSVQTYIIGDSDTVKDHYNPFPGQPGYNPNEPANTVFWDPSASIIVQDQNGATLGVRSAADLWMHEFAHATDPNFPNDATPDSQYDWGSERYAVGVEDNIAEQQGEISRLNHAGNYILGGNSTDHTVVNPDGTSSWQEQLFDGAVTVTGGVYTPGTSPALPTLPGTETGTNSFDADNAVVKFSAPATTP